MNGIYGFGGYGMSGFDPMNMLSGNLQQYLDGIKQQISQQYTHQQNPYAQIDARIEAYMTQNGYPPRQQQQQLPAPQAAALPPPQQQNPMQLVTAAISESVSAADMELIATNIAMVPDWLRTTEGKKIVQQATAGIKKFVGGKSSAANSDATTDTGNTT